MGDPKVLYEGGGLELTQRNADEGSGSELVIRHRGGVVTEVCPDGVREAVRALAAAYSLDVGYHTSGLSVRNDDRLRVVLVDDDGNRVPRPNVVSVDPNGRLEFHCNVNEEAAARIGLKLDARGRAIPANVTPGPADGYDARLDLTADEVRAIYAVTGQVTGSVADSPRGKLRAVRSRIEGLGIADLRRDVALAADTVNFESYPESGYLTDLPNLGDRVGRSTRASADQVVDGVDRREDAVRLACDEGWFTRGADGYFSYRGEGHVYLTKPRR